MSKPNVHRVDTQEMAERLVIAWVERDAAPPVHLAPLVQRYQILKVYVENPSTPLKAADQVEKTMADIYDRLVAAATPRTVAPAKQIRRLGRRAEARMSYQDKCDRAIAEWRAARG